MRNTLYDLCLSNKEYEYLLNEWDYEKNFCTPKDVTISSSDHVYWRCPNGHSYNSRIDHRVRVHSGCPYCANHKLLVGYNDLESWAKNNGFDYLLDEWDKEKNGELQPSEVMYCTNKCGNVWETKVNSRTGEKKSGCPNCHSRGTSFFEQVILYYLSKYFEDIKHRYKIGGIEIDIFIPSLKTGIEYDGVFYHRNRIEKDKEKNFKCLTNNISLIRIREKGLDKIDNCICIMRERNERRFFDSVLIELLDILGIKNIDVNIDRDYTEILNKYHLLETEESILISHPEISKEWDYEKNGLLTPETFTKGSNEIVWWRCSKCNNSYMSSISHRTRGSGCPYCANKKIKKGQNDFVTWCIKNNKELLLEEWDYSKNEKGPDEYFAGTLEKVWWKCKKCGFEWQAPLNNRSRGRGCARCKGKYGGPRAVICIETGEIFKTVNEVAEKLGKSRPDMIRMCCKGDLKTAYGMHWKYIDDFEKIESEVIV